MAPGGQRQPLDATSAAHADMRREWVRLYEDILAHNADGSKPFPACADAAHVHHDPGCTHCAVPVQPEDPEDPVEPEPAKPKPEPKPKPDPDPVEPVCPCGTAILVVRVKDEDGNTIEGAEIFAGAAGNRVTDADGLADFGEIEPGIYDIFATKPGHAPKRGDPEGDDEACATDVPSGATTVVDLIQHPLCASVAMFEGPTTGRTKYFGFDPKSNKPATTTGNYWKPVPAHGDISMGGRNTRDGGRWVSVAVGAEVELEIEFDFKSTECIPCIENSTYVVSDANVAEVLTKTIGAKKATFKIKGKASGEASLKVMCDGKEIGWFHIWCKPWVTLKLDVACVVTNRAANTAFSANAIQTLCNSIYRQAAIKFDVKSLGVIDLTSDLVFWAKETLAYNAAGTDFTSGEVVLGWIHSAAEAALAARAAGPAARPAAYRAYFYVPQNADAGGMVINIGASPAFVFFGPGASADNSVAHEIGHSLGLNHPAHDGTAGQYPGHLISTLNTATTAQSSTNTEAAVTAKAAHFNIMADDAHNLMGYWQPKPDRQLLRYRQWKALKRR